MYCLFQAVLLNMNYYTYICAYTIFIYVRKFIHLYKDTYTIKFYFYILMTIFILHCKYIMRSKTVGNNGVSNLSRNICSKIGCKK